MLRIEVGVDDTLKDELGLPDREKLATTDSEEFSEAVLVTDTAPELEMELDALP